MITVGYSSSVEQVIVFVGGVFYVFHCKHVFMVLGLITYLDEISTHPSRFIQILKSKYPIGRLSI
jgi:hypothetical protein